MTAVDYNVPEGDPRPRSRRPARKRARGQRETPTVACSLTLAHNNGEELKSNEETTLGVVNLAQGEGGHFRFSINLKNALTRMLSTNTPCDANVIDTAVPLRLC